MKNPTFTQFMNEVESIISNLSENELKKPVDVLSNSLQLK